MEDPGGVVGGWRSELESDSELEKGRGRWGGGVEGVCVFVSNYKYGQPYNFITQSTQTSHHEHVSPHHHLHIFLKVGMLYCL